MAMLTAYFDESGTLGEDKRATLATEGFIPHRKQDKQGTSSPPSKASRSISVACYIASIESWDHFECDWKRLRDLENIQFYHRTDQESFRKQFKSWTKAQQIASYQAQHAIIKHWTFAGFGCSLVKQEYDAIFKGAARLTMGDAYCFCIRFLLNMVYEWALRTGHDDEPVNYVFESGAMGWGQVDGIFRQMLNDEELAGLYRIAGYSAAKKSEVVPLQSADALAFECWKNAENRIVDGPRRNLRKSFLDLFRRNVDRSVHCTAKSFAGLIEAGRQEGLDDPAALLDTLRRKQKRK
jgi:hypothetical protein